MALKQTVLKLELLSFSILGALLMQTLLMFAPFVYHTYSKQHILDLANQLRPVDVIDRQKVRVGNLAGDGYVMLEEKHFDKLYSYGVEKDISFEEDFIKKWPVPAYVYDPRITQLPVKHPSKLVHWYREGIAPLQKAHLNTLAAHVASHGDNNKKCMMLKMNVGGAEWESLDKMDEKLLSQFCQIVLEFHGLTSSRYYRAYQVKLDVLQKLNKLFHIVHVHGNNSGAIYQDETYLLPDVLEVSYLRKDPDIQVKPSTTSYPVAHLDYPSKPDAKDIVLNKFPFVALASYYN